MQHTYHVTATWDDEAGVWHSESDVPGLVIEAETLAEFEALIRDLVPELLADNEKTSHEPIRVDLGVTGHRRIELAAA